MCRTSGGVVDGEDALEVAMGLEDVLRDLVALVACPVPRQHGHDLDRHVGAAVGLGDALGEGFRAQLHRFHVGVVDDRHSTSTIASAASRPPW
jgi:hypothetical protein